jgi:hypothetical protein
MLMYLMVRWHHDGGEDPIVLYHEIAEGQREVRRIELFEDGRLQRSDKVEPDALTSLSLEPLPSLDEIREQPEFSAVEIGREAFEEVWNRAGEGRG